MSILEVTYKEIERLDPLQLTQLLRILLHLECDAHDVQRSAVSVSLKINEPDEGEDGRVKWADGPDRTEFIPSRFTLFQCKAERMTKAKCDTEVRGKRSKEVKLKVAEVLDHDGTYLLFCSKSFKDNQSRIEGLREGLKKGGRADWESANIEVYNGHKIAEWTNRFSPAVVFVRRSLELSVPCGLKTWSEWARYPGSRYDYVSSRTLQSYVDALRDQAGKRQTITRVVGLSGLGKTRLALEAFRPPSSESEIEAGIRSYSMIYADAGAIEGGQIVNLIADLCNSGSSHGGVFVVDDCGHALHEKLAQEVLRTDSKFSLITLDFDLAEPKPGTQLVHLKQEDCKGVVQSIIKQAYPGLPSAAVSKVEELAQDFPQMAVLMAQQVHQGIGEIGCLPREGVIDKMLWGRDTPPKEEKRIITVCSLVTHFMFSNESATSQMEALSEIAGGNVNKFYEVCAKFIRRGVIQTGGRFARVSPPPLAITLAAEWWSGVMVEHAKQVMGKFARCQLINEFCAQVSNLHFSTKAQELTKALCGDKGLFRDAEVLNSEEGSQLFREFAKVSPQTTMDALDATFRGWTREQLLDVEAGRRNLVWALQDLCWWPETFGQAARLLLRFAVAENETWGNNSTGAFLQLFQAYLPGTQANLHQRVEIAREALSSGVVEEQALGVKALGRALETGPYVRPSQVESQGSRVPTPDYIPKSKEVYEYWEQCIGLLTEQAIRVEMISELARQELGKRVRALVPRGMLDEIQAAISTVLSKTGKHWPEATCGIRDLIDHESSRMPADILKRVQALEHLLTSVDLDIGERLRLAVTIPGWRHVKGQDGHYTDLNVQAAEELAEDLAAQGEVWYDKLHLVFDGQQQKGYVFGRQLARAGTKPTSFLDKALECLRSLAEERGDPTVLGGFLDGLDDRDPVAATLTKMALDDRLVPYIVRVTAMVSAQEDDLDRLLRLVDEGRLGVKYLWALKFGDPLGHLEPKSVSRFCNSLSAFGLEYAWCALGILYLYCFPADERFKACHETLRHILLCQGLLRANMNASTEIYDWQSASEKLLSFGADARLAKHIANEIVEASGTADAGHMDLEHAVQSVLAVVLHDYAAEVWPVLSDALISADWRTASAMRHILGIGHDKEKGECLLSRLPEDVIIDWCVVNTPRAPTAIAEIMPLFGPGGSETSWHPLTRKIIDKFGDIAEVRNATYLNMLSFTSCGSRVPYYERRRKLLEELHDHSSNTVRNWAKAGARALQADIEEAARRDAEQKFGVW